MQHSLQQAQKAVEQLRREKGVVRMPISQSINELIW